MAYLYLLAGKWVVGEREEYYKISAAEILCKRGENEKWLNPHIGRFLFGPERSTIGLLFMGHAQPGLSLRNYMKTLEWA